MKKVIILLLLLFMSSAFADTPISGDCAGVLALPGQYQVSEAVNPVGVYITFGGGDGTGYALNSYPDLKNQIVALGYTVIQIKWAVPGWFDAPSDVGFELLSCRVAEAIREVRALYPQGTLVVAGQSGGAGQVSYALAFHGIDDIADKIILMGGPPMSALQKSCSALTEFKKFWLANNARKEIDQAFGYHNSDGPCFLKNPAWYIRLAQESVSTGGYDYAHPNTEVIFLIGDQDTKMQTVSGDYRLKLLASGTSYTYQIIIATPHLVISTDAGRAALVASIVQ
jgi:hypothetical protein